MSDKKLIAVVGSTGAQGGSVLKYLLDSGRYRVRALTRDPNSTECLNLKTKWGASIELWKCDMAIADEVIKAFTGCWGAFLMTDFYDDPKLMVDKEVTLGRILIDSSVEAKLKFAVWSSLPNVDTLTEGRLNVPMFTNKALVEEYVRNEFRGRTIDTTFSFVYPGFYIQNFNTLSSMNLKLGTNNVLVNDPALPLDANTRIPMLNIDEFGGFVLPMFDNWEKFKLAPVFAFNDWITMPNFLGIVGNILGVNSKYIQCTYDEYYGITQNLYYVHMFRWFNDVGFFGNMDVGNWKQIFKNLMPIDQAIKTIDWRTRIGGTQRIGLEGKGTTIGKGTTTTTESERMREGLTSKQAE